MIEVKETKPVWLIVDIDNNIADNKHRKYLIEGPEKKDWDKFNALALYDEPNVPLINAIHKFAENPDVKILFITGRNNKEESKNVTYEWLIEQGFKNPHVAFRGKKNFNPNNEIKVLNVAYHLSKYELPENFQMIVVEDSQKVLDAFNTALSKDFKVTTLLSDVKNNCADVIAKLEEIGSHLKSEKLQNNRPKIKI